MFMDENIPNSRFEKHEVIVEMLNDDLHQLITKARRGAETHDEIVHVQRQIRFHRDMLA